MHFDRLLVNLRLATMAEGMPGLGIRDQVAIGVQNGRIAWIGGPSELGGDVERARTVDDLGGRWVTPALIDCHTHLVFAGNRSDEWARRLANESYASIAQQGGGILATVDATRRAAPEELQAGTCERLATLAQEGVGTVEIKSGYGLDIKTELLMLRTARAAGEAAGLRVRTSLLAAHAIPPEYRNRAEAYIAEVCIPLVHMACDEGLVDSVDAFCEAIAFLTDEVRPLFEAARSAGLPVRLHADQLSDTGGAALAAEFGALSADHLEYTSEEGIGAMAEAGTVAVLLPGAFYTIGETRVPPVDALRAAGVRVAVATDANPGSSPLLSLLTAANMSCTLFGLAFEEAFAGITREAAHALGLQDDLGTVEVGKWAELAVWDVEHPAEIIQWLGRRPLNRSLRAGEWV